MPGLSGTLSVQKKYQTSEPVLAGWSKLELAEHTEERLPANAEGFAVGGHCLEDSEYLDGVSIVVMSCPQELCDQRDCIPILLPVCWAGSPGESCLFPEEVPSPLTVMRVCVFRCRQK